MTLAIEEIKDKKTYQSFILDYGKWNLFQSWEWGEVQKRLGIETIRFGIYEKALVGLVSVYLIKAKRGTFLHLRHGPVLDPNYHTKTVWQQLISTLQVKFQNQHPGFIRVSPMLENTPENKLLLKATGFRPAPIHALDAEIAWVLDINQSEEHLLSQMRKTTRYLVRQAEKIGVKVEKSTNITLFLELYKNTASRHKFVEHKGIKEEFEVFAQNGSCDLLMAKYDGKVLAAALILYFGKQAIYHHGASESGKIPAAYLLQWQAIKAARARGCTLYNFWGIASENRPKHPWQGITLFKKGFGGREVQFIHVHDYPLSWEYIFPYTIERLRRWQRGY